LGVRLIPEHVPAQAARNDGERECGGRQPRHLAGGKQQTAADLYRGIDPRKVLCVGGDIRADGVRQLAHAVEGGARRVGGGFGISKGIHALPDKGH